MVSSSFLVFAVVAAVTSAQDATLSTSNAPAVAPSTTVSQVMPPAATADFNAASVNSSIRATWCQGQLNNCPQICEGAASANFCDREALTYDCVCGNGTVPDVTAYADTLPFYICQESYIQCVAAHPDDREGQQTCTENQQCGSRNATAEFEAAAGGSDDSDSEPSPTESGASAAESAADTASSTASEAAATSSDSAAMALSYEVSTSAFAVLLAGAFALFA